MLPSYEYYLAINDARMNSATFFMEHFLTVIAVYHVLHIKGVDDLLAHAHQATASCVVANGAVY